MKETFYCKPLCHLGDRGNTVVKVLCYKSEGIFHCHKILLIALWPWGRLGL